MTVRRHAFTDLLVPKTGRGDEPAIIMYSGEVLTYGHLIGIMARTQAALSRFDIHPYQRVALVSDNALTFIPVTLGIMESAACVPFDSLLPMEQYAERFKHLGIDYLMCNMTSGAMLDAAREQGVGIIKFCVRGDFSVEFELAAKPAMQSDPQPGNDRIACIFTTSGTMGQPKIIPVIYDDMTGPLITRARHHDFEAASVQLLPIKLDRYISLHNALCSLIPHGTVVCTDGVHPGRIVSMLQDHRITHFSLQPAGMVALIEYMEKNSIKPAKSHRMQVIMAGAPMPPGLKPRIEEYFNAEVAVDYGMSETGMITSTHKAPRGFKPGSVGCPVHLQVRVIDDEIFLKGPGIFTGYENNPEATREAFLDGWFRTGDTGYFDEDGYLFLTGRVRELINRGGEKVAPYEVEAALMSLGNIKDAAVFPYPNNKGYENVGAAIVSDTGFSSLREVRSALKDKISPFKLPTLLYQVDRIPVSPANKVQRSRLYEQLNDLGFIPESLSSPPSPGESELTTTQFVIRGIWKDILAFEHVGIDDNFFDLGGDSLSAAEVLTSIESSFGCVLPVNDFFNRATIRELAELIQQIPNSNPFKHLVPIRVGGSKTPLFFFHERSGDVVTYHHVAEGIDKGRPVYGLRLNWQREAWGPETNMSDVASAYVEEIQQVQRAGPYYLAGLSIGGQIAFAAGSILAAKGADVIVFMLDTYSRQYIRRRGLLNSARATIQPGRMTPLLQMPKLFYRKFGTLYQEFILPELNSKSGHSDNTWLEKKWAEAKSPEEQQQVLLRAIGRRHRPASFSGTLCYFKALRNRINNEESHRYWRSLSKEFILFEADCQHAQLVEPMLAADTAAKMVSVMEQHQAGMQPQ